MISDNRQLIITKILERQGLHLLSLSLLLCACLFATRLSEFSTGSLAGVSTTTWFWTATGLAIVHQMYVLVCWRLELHLGFLSHVFGTSALRIYATGFGILGIARVLAVFATAYSNRGTLPFFQPILQGMAVIALIPAFYTFYSVARYFGYQRAVGADHFDSRYRSLPLVNRGAFGLTSNAMYALGFLLLWAPGLWWQSLTGLIAAAFQHAYIWVHYHCTEKPDMQRIYKPNSP